MRIFALRMGGLQRSHRALRACHGFPPPHPIVGDCYKAWTATDQWEKLYDHDNLYAGPLFVHHFSHAWIDFRGIRVRFMR